MSVSLIKRSKIWSAAWLDGAQTNIRPLCQRSRGADMAETTNCTRNEVFPVPGGPCTMENGFCKPRCTANCCFSFSPACSTRAADFRITWLTSKDGRSYRKTKKSLLTLNEHRIRALSASNCSKWLVQGLPKVAFPLPSSSLVNFLAESSAYHLGVVILACPSKAVCSFSHWKGPE